MNRVTLTLLRKDASWLLGFLVLGSIVSFWSLFGQGFDSAYVLPLGRSDLRVVMVVLAAGLGIFFSLRERVGRTQDFLRHRPLSAARLFWSRTLACMTVVAAWPVIATALLMLNESVLGLGIGCTDSHNLAEIAVTTCYAEASLALLIFVFCLPVHWAWRLASLVPIWWGGIRILEWIGSSSLPLMIVAVVFVLGAVRFAEEAGHDSDRRLARTPLLAGGPFVLLTVFLAGVNMTGCLEGYALDAIARPRPFVALVAPGELALIGRDGAGFPILNAELTPSGRLYSLGEYSLSWLGAPEPPFSRWSRAPSRQTDFGCIRLDESRLRWVVWRPDSQSVRVIDRDKNSRTCWLLANPDGKSLSKETFLVDEQGNDSESVSENHIQGFIDLAATGIFIVDPTAGAIWRVGPEIPPRLVPTPLPAGDRPVEICRSVVNSHSPSYSSRNYRTAVRGTDGLWFPTRSGWEPATETHKELTMKFLDPDVLEPEVEVSTKDGLTLRHRYALARGQSVFAGAAMLASVLLPAPTAIVATIRGYEPTTEGGDVDTPAWLFDPLLACGYRWLLVPNLLLTALLAAWIARTMKRRGASRARSLFWTLGVACAGPAGLLVFLAFEPRRAWRRPVQTEPAPLLIRAA